MSPATSGKDDRISDLASGRLPLLRDGYAAPKDLAEMRKYIAELEMECVLPDSIEMREEVVADVPCRIVGGNCPNATVLYFHGGGFRMGSSILPIGLLCALAEKTGCRFVVPDYSLAPENPFPKALHEALAIQGELAKDGPVLVGGDSAGGNLALVASNLAECGSIAGTFLISPWLDLTLRSATYRSKAETDKVFSLKAAEDAARAYLQGHSAEDPLVSPVFHESSEIKSCFLLVGGCEVLLGDSIALVNKLSRSSCRLEFHCLPHMQHVAITRDVEFPGAAQALDRIAGYLKTSVGLETGENYG